MGCEKSEVGAGWARKLPVGTMGGSKQADLRAHHIAEDLRARKVQQVIARFERLRPKTPEVRKCRHALIRCCRSNAARMRRVKRSTSEETAWLLAAAIGYPLSTVSRQPGSGQTYLRTFLCRSRLEINMGRPCLSQTGWSAETMGGSSLLGVTYPSDSLKQRWQNLSVQRKNSTE